MMNNKKCPKCGQELDERCKFCYECGTEIPQEEQAKKRGRKKKIEEQALVEKEIKIEEVSKEEKQEDQLENELQLKEKELKKVKRGRFLRPILSCVITFILCLIAFAFFYDYYLKNLVIETTKREVTITDTGISEAVAKVYDSVVVVESYKNNKLYSTGTGFVYKTKEDKAYILTNHHVIESADEVKVVFTNNTKEQVEILGSDKYSDVAVLGIDKEKIISIAELGSSEELKVGDTAFAVGAPLDSSTYAWTVTRGIISGKDRVVQTQDNVMKVLQTDTAINSGNSGGPLCNSNGQVIGITNMKLASTSVEGMGFAIPIETAVEMAETLMEGKEVRRPYLGIEVGEMRNSQTQETYLIVGLVTEGGAADKAGMKTDDIILAVNDVKVNTIAFFQHELYKYKIGEKIKITIERDGEEKTLVIKLGSKGKEA